MMSMEVLQARIAKISTDIELQKAVLKNLEHSKILLQRQLNSVRDPVARLPLEISSEIFIQCLPPLPLPPGPHQIPMILLNICRAWTDIALSTPALWTTSFISCPCTEDFQRLLKTWLQRSRQLPSSVRLSGHFEEGAAPIIQLFGQQLKHLEVYYEKDEFNGGYIDVLGGASAGPLPLLETLTIRSSPEPKPQYRGPQLLQLLRLAPNLAECTFGCNTQPVYSVSAVQEPLVLPNLRRLIFGDDVDDPTTDDGILEHLTLPRLETLSLSMYILYGPHFSAFLKRSSPPLRELVVGVGCANEDITQLDECLRLVPTLVRFELWWPEGSVTVEQFFAPWAESPSSLLPNLRSLTIKFHSTPNIPDSAWEALLRVFTARRTKIRTIRIKFYSPSSKPSAQILAAFEELVADGMEVYIGTEDQDFCAVQV
ncbi:hypothetical protein B0H11DRAFT_2288133 [Mycena galericulata]|nr:hypothetical protein B0H11DRAFT_2288133 [Mycena galericulata]